MTAIVRAERLGFTYSGAPYPVLSDASFEIEDGELLVMAGPSGGGKSTLLRCMNGLIPHFHGGAFRGKIEVAGIDTRERQPRDLAHLAGMVFQDPESQAVAPTVEEEIVFGLENLGAPRVLIRKRLEESLDVLGLAALRKRALTTLSGGELQRVAIAAVLTMQPRVLLLDEPTSQLDPQAAEDVLHAAVALRADAGLTIVIAEHRLERLVQHADRIMEVPGDGTVSLHDVRSAIARLPSAPPVTAIGRALGWAPLPLSIAEARRFASPRRPDGGSPVVNGPPRAAGDVAVSVRSLNVTLGGQRALRSLSLDLRDGEVVALMGRNGAGKTTLLRAIARLVKPASGAVALTHLSADQPYHHLAYVAQNPGSMLYHDTVRREIADVVSGTGRGAHMDDALDEWRLRDLADCNPLDLSVGERQRVAIAAMLAGAPRVILLDEPTRGMDHENKELLVRNLRARARSGATIVLASHDVELAARCATRVVLLAEGELIADGPAAAVLSDSITFSTQANKLFGGNVLTVEDALAAMEARS
jgi:energy-coupling factor transporter ATP-binding protein EcfA2